MKTHKYVIILLDSLTPAFCYYEPRKKKEKISLMNLKKAVEYCREHDLFATVVYPEYQLESAKQKLLDKFVHIRILPLHRADELTEGDILTVNYEPEKEQFEKIPVNTYLNIVLRIKMSQIRDLEMLYYRYRNRFCRLTIILTDIETADEDALNRYRLHLSKVKDYIYRSWNFDWEFQMSILTDRIFLNQMNHCNAGITHFTIAPNGKFYICPGFYMDNPKQTIGSFTEEIRIANSHLLDIEHSPVCSVCDCFQCKRCIYLNKRTTLETNIPSHTQCVVSHHERNISGILLEKLQNRGCLSNLPKIKPLFYLDPMENIGN